MDDPRRNRLEPAVKDEGWSVISKRKQRAEFTDPGSAEHSVLFEASGDMSSPAQFAMELGGRRGQTSMTVGAFESTEKPMKGADRNKEYLEKVGATVKQGRDARRNSITQYDEIHIENIHSGEYRPERAVASQSTLTAEVFEHVSQTKLKEGGELHFGVSGWPYQPKEKYAEHGQVDILGLAESAGLELKNVYDRRTQVARNSGKSLGEKTMTTYVFGHAPPSSPAPVSTSAAGPVRGKEAMPPAADSDTGKRSHTVGSVTFPFEPPPMMDIQFGSFGSGEPSSAPPSAPLEVPPPSSPAAAPRTIQFGNMPPIPIAAAPMQMPMTFGGSKSGSGTGSNKGRKGQ